MDILATRWAPKWCIKCRQTKLNR